jgi:hypothetical protein
MTEKIIGLYPESIEGLADLDNSLFLVISNTELACMVIKSGTKNIIAFETFHLTHQDQDWSDIFFDIRTKTEILNQNFKEVRCIFNFPEALVMPEEKFNMMSATEYLSLIYGENSKEVTKFDLLLPKKGMYNVFRIDNNLIGWLDRHFTSYQANPMYSSILNDIFRKDPEVGIFIRIDVYRDYFSLVVVKEQQLYLIQSYPYLQEEDILYHVLNALHQFDSADLSTHLEISGMINTDSELFWKLKCSFTEISLDNIGEGGKLFADSVHQLHYFTPYYKLVV